ncbi:MAG TPA: hypothetical protein VNW15_05680 [Rhizomicrobium sp.]|jgi:hypothetical protein|nr:hypothetical protein [Rhizomicrobium sp.]
MNSDHDPNSVRETKVEDLSLSHLLAILFIVWMTELAMFHAAI